MDLHVPIKRFPIISRAVIMTVRRNVGKSSVEERVSANPKGSMGGIQPVIKEALVSIGPSRHNTYLGQARGPNILPRASCTASRGPYVDGVGSRDHRPERH